MVPNGAAYDNYPSFANNGTKTPPGGSTESAKYALGMVPADTFPAEWANYLFHGATAGITRLNSDTGSIKKEINTVLSNFNITPDATVNTQLMEALKKLKAEAALAAHPVGSLYWTSVNENPATTFGGGTWTQIKDKFILAAGDTYSNGATGGSATVTLTTSQIPSHNHSFTPSGTIGNKTAGGTIGDTTATGTIGNKTAGGSISGGAYSFSGNTRALNIITGGYWRAAGSTNISESSSTTTNGAGVVTNNDYQKNVRTWSWTDGGTISVTANPTFTGAAHNHTFTGSAHNHTFTGTAHNHTFTGTEGTTGNKGDGAAHENMPPYIVKYCWQRTA